MKKIAFFFVFLMAALVNTLYAQKTSPKIEADQVPEAVKTNYDNELGYPVDYWSKMTLKNAQIRYVAVYTAMDQSSGKMLQNHVRYTQDGKNTSSTVYLGNGEGNAKDSLSIYLGTGGVSESTYEKFNKILKENTLISFEKLSFYPGNQTESVRVFRFVLKTKKGKQVAYYDQDMNEFDMSKYPIRFMEAEEMDE